MARKPQRPSVVDDVDLTEEAEIPTRTQAGAVEAPPAPVPTPRRKARGDIHHTSLYVPKAAYRKIREIAFAQDRKPHDVIMEGLDLVLKQYGHPPVAELKGNK